MTRLALLFVLMGISLQLSATAPTITTSQWHGDGRMRIFNYHLDEFAEIQFRDGNKELEDGVAAIRHLLRSRDNGEVSPIAIRLIDLLDHLQDHFEADTIEIISGYRSPALNKQLQREGHAVSPVSLHVKGQATDIHIDEIREETLRDYLQGLKGGGVGYYGPMDFVHVDLGPVRKWGQTGPFPRKLVGVLEPDAPLQLTSDRNDYLPGSTLSFRWTGAARDTLRELQLEHFHRGRWEVITAVPRSAQQATFRLDTTDPLFHVGARPRYGKYRWTFRHGDALRLMSSNEFYLKRQ